MKKSLLFSKKGAMDAKFGVDIAVSAIFILAIGLSIVVGVIFELEGSGNASNALLTGIAATVVGYAPLIIGAVFIYGVARMGGVI